MASSALMSCIIACRPSRIEGNPAKRCGPQSCHHTGAVTAVAVVVLSQLGVSDPMPALQAPALSHQLQEGFWAGAQARDQPLRGLERLALPGADGDHLNNSAGAMPVRFDVLRPFLGAQGSSDDAAVGDIVIRCYNKGSKHSLELALDLAVERCLVGFNRQQEVGSLLRGLSKNGCWLCSASAWISTPLRSCSPRRFLSTARSLFSPVA